MEVYYSTRKGNRITNEDSILINKKIFNNSEIKLKKYFIANKTINKFILCDGIGGINHGEIASKLVLEIFSKSFRNFNKSLVENFIELSYETLELYCLNNNIHQFGTTIAGVFLGLDTNLAFNLGDTRIYKITKENISQLSYDHTLAQRLFERGEISKEYISHHSSRNILTSAICSNFPFERETIHFNSFLLKKNDIIFICSDGIWEQIKEKELYLIFKKSKNFKLALNKILSNTEISPNDNLSFIAIKK